MEVDSAVVVTASAFNIVLFICPSRSVCDFIHDALFTKPSRPSCSSLVPAPPRASSHRRFPSSGGTEPGGSNSLQSSPIRSLPHWNTQSSMPSTPDLRTRAPHYVHSTRSDPPPWNRPKNTQQMEPAFTTHARMRPCLAF